MSSTYGPEPAEVALRYLSAVSAFDALPAALPPLASTCLLLTIDRFGPVTIARISGRGVSAEIVTACSPSALIERPSTWKAGSALTFLSRSNEKTTSAEVTALPSENLAAGSSSNVYARPSLDTLQLLASRGCGLVMSVPS